MVGGYLIFVGVCLSLVWLTMRAYAFAGRPTPVEPEAFKLVVIDLEHWPTWARLLFQALGGRDGDNRSWPDIDAWADQIAEALDQKATDEPVTSIESARRF